MITFEIYEDGEEKEHFVSVKVNNGSKVNFCYRDEATQTDCSLQEFINKTQSLVIRQKLDVLREQFCIDKDYTKYQRLVGVMGLLAFCFGVLSVFMFKVIRTK